MCSPVCRCGGDAPISRDANAFRNNMLQFTERAENMCVIFILSLIRFALSRSRLGPRPSTMYCALRTDEFIKIMRAPKSRDAVRPWYRTTPKLPANGFSRSNLIGKKTILSNQSGDKKKKIHLRFRYRFAALDSLLSAKTKIAARHSSRGKFSREPGSTIAPRRKLQLCLYLSNAIRDFSPVLLPDIQILCTALDFRCSS